MKIPDLPAKKARREAARYGSVGQNFEFEDVS
ncbi:MAG: hypothetical protein ACI9BW_000982 [Gammaproteobacteria bacterium]|jgi:hypothetical protein